MKNKIAIMGTRGIPAAYGGFETFAEELAVRLVKKDYQVTVWGRRFFSDERELLSSYEGVRIKNSFTIRHKYLETPLAALSSFSMLIFDKPDLVLLCNAANSPMAWIIKLLGIPLLINVDGIERKRTKWNALGRLWYKIGERASVMFANRIISDAEVIAEYYLERFKLDSTVIAYGADAKYLPAGPVHEKFKLEPGKFVLYVSRLEPENNALGVIEAYKKVKSDLPLVIVGDAPYATAYKQKLIETADSRVIFTGFQFGAAYQELRSNCAIYIQATEVGGTHPALVEAMAYGNPIIANASAENLEVLASAGLFYDFNNFDHLAEQMQKLLDDSDLRVTLAKLAKSRAAEKYSWDAIVKQYIKLFTEYLA